MTYVLHYAPDNASLIVRLALEELGLRYETRLVDRRAKAHRQTDYLELNPAGRIPVLETPDGPIFETAAILLWLSERHGALAPAPGEARRGWFLKWLIFMSNDVHSNLRLLFYTERYIAPNAVQAMRDGLKTSVQQNLTLLNAASLADNSKSLDGEARHFGSDGISVLDCYLGPLLRWCVLFPTDQAPWFNLDTYPALKAAVKSPVSYTHLTLPTIYSV